MKKSLFTLLFLTLPLQTLAETRSSSVSANYQFATDEFRNTQLAGSVGLSSIFSLNLQGQRATENKTLTSRSFFLGADAIATPDVNIRFGLQGGSEPNELKNGGATIGVSYSLSSLWSGERLTRISLDLERNRYKQDTVASATVRSGDFTQSGAHLGLFQEFTKTLSASLSLSSYRYRDGSNYNGAIGRRRLQPIRTEGLVEGFPDRAGDLLFSWNAFDETTFSLGAGAARTVASGEKTKTHSLNIAQGLGEHWTLLAGYTHSKAPSLRASDLGQVGVSYLF